MDDLKVAPASPSPEHVTEKPPSTVEGSLISWETNCALSEYSCPTTAPLRLSCRQSQNDDGSTEVLTTVNSGSSLACSPWSSNEGNQPLRPTRPGVVACQEQDTYSGSSRPRITASLHVEENGVCSELRGTHDSASVSVGGCPTRFIQNTSLSPEGVFPNEEEDDDKLNAPDPCLEVLKRGGGNFGGQGEVLGRSVTTLFPVHKVSFLQSEIQQVEANDSRRVRRRGAHIGQDRLRRSLSPAAGIERGEKGTPNIGLVHDVIDNLLDEFQPRPTNPGASRKSSSLRPSRSPLQSPRRRSPGMTPSTQLLGPGGGGRPSSSFARNRDSISSSASLGSRHATHPPDEDPDRNQVIERVWSACTLLESITGELTTEKRQLYQSKSNLPTPESEDQMLSAMAVSHNEIEDGPEYRESEERGTPAEIGTTKETWKRKARKRKLQGKPAKMPKSMELPRCSVRSYMKIMLKGGEEMSTYDSADPEPELTLKIQKRKARLDGKTPEIPEGKEQLRRSSPSYTQKMLKGGEEMRTYDSSEPEPQRTLKLKEGEAKLDGKPAEMPEAKEQPRRSSPNDMQKMLKGGEEMRTHDSSEPEPQRTLKLKEGEAKLDGKPAEMPEAKEQPRRSSPNDMQKMLKGGEEMRTHDSSEPEPQRTLKLNEGQAKLDGKPAEMPEGKGQLRRSSPSHSPKKLKHGDEDGHGETRLKDSVDRIPSAPDASSLPEVKEDEDSLSGSPESHKKKSLTGVGTHALTKKAAAGRRSKKALRRDRNSLQDKNAESPDADAARTCLSGEDSAAPKDVSDVGSPKGKGFLRRNAVARDKKSPTGLYKVFSLFGKKPAATKGSAATKSKAETGGRDAKPNKVPSENTSPESTLDAENVEPLKHSKRRAGKNTAGRDNKGGIYTSMKSLLGAFTGKGATKAVSGKKTAPGKEESSSVSASKSLSPEPSSTSSPESSGAAQSEKSKGPSVKKPGKKKAPGKTKRPSGSARKSLSPEPSSTSSPESSGATQSQKSKGPSVKKTEDRKKKTQKKVMSPILKKAAPAKKKSGKVSSTGREATKVAKEDDSDGSVDDSEDEEQNETSPSTSPRVAKVVIQDTKQFHSKASKSSQKVEEEPSEGDYSVQKAVIPGAASGKVSAIERESRHKIGDKETESPKWMFQAGFHDEPETATVIPGTASGKVNAIERESRHMIGVKETESPNWMFGAGFQDEPKTNTVIPWTASGKVNAIERESRHMIGVKETESPNWMFGAAFHDEPQTKNIKGDVKRGGRGHVPSVQTGQKTEVRKQEKMRSKTGVGVDLKGSSDTSKYESCRSEYYLPDANKHLLGPSTHREVHKFAQGQGGGLSTNSSKSNVRMVDRGTVTERSALCEASLPTNSDIANKLKGLHRRDLDSAEQLERPFPSYIELRGLAEKPGEAGGKHDETNRIYLRSSQSSSSVSSVQVGIYTHTERSGKRGISSSPSLNYGQKRMTRAPSAQKRIPRCSSLRATQPGPRPLSRRKRKVRSQSFQWINGHETSRVNTPIRSRTSRTMPRGPSSADSQLYARKSRRRQGLPSTSPAQHYGPTAGVDRSQNFPLSRQGQPHSPFLPYPRSVTRRFRTPEGAEVILSLHAELQPTLPLPAHKVPSKTSRMIKGTSFSTFAGVEAAPQNAQTSFHGTYIEGPSGCYGSPATVVAPEDFNAEPPEPVVIHDATPAPVTLLAAGDADQKRSRRVVSADIKELSRSRSRDVTHSMRASEEEGNSSFSNPNMTYRVQNDLLRAGEGEEQAAFRSTDKIIPTRRNRLRVDFVKQFYHPASTVVYGVLVVGALAGITAGFLGYFGRYAAPSLLSDITDIDDDATGRYEAPWVFNPGARGVRPLSVKEECRHPWCSKQLAALIRSLNNSVRPCEDFYCHVCSKSGVRNATNGKKLSQPAEQHIVGFFRRTVRSGREAKVLRASRRLWKGCVDVATLKRLGNVPLQDLLNTTGLGGWPYNRGDALPDVWEAAGKLQRLMELAPLVEVNLGPRKTLRLFLGDLNTTVGSDDVLGAMRIMRRDSSWLGQLAEDVAAFGHKMTALAYSHEPPMSHHRLSDADLVLRPFLRVALEGLGRDAGAVRTELGSFIDPLVQLVRETRPETVLNLLGYRLVRHVGLFTPAVVNADLGSAQPSRRRSRCTRVVLEDALTGDAAEYIRYAALQSQLDFDAILSVKTDLKRVLSAKLANLPWMNNQTRKRAQQRLRDLKVRFSFGRYEDANGSAPVFPVEALPSQALATYQLFREARFRSRMLGVGAAEDNATDPDCTHDARENVLYLRLSSAVETHDIRSPLWPVLQAARLVPMLSRCMLRVLLLPETTPHRKAEHRGNRMSAAGSARFNELLACLRTQHTIGRSASTGRGRGKLAAIHSAALEPARNAYDAYAVRLARETSLEQRIRSRDARTTLGWNQLYYVAYARAMCESPDHRGLKEPHIPQRELVNGPLSNDRGFHRAFNCRRGDPMRPEPTCHFWDRPPR